MKHRERLQASIARLQEVQDEVGYLRDHATPEMKTEYTKVREFLPIIWGFLQKVDNELMPDSISKQEL